MIGARFGSLTVRGLMDRNVGGMKPQQGFACECDCGTFTIASESQLRGGRATGCNRADCDGDVLATALRRHSSVRVRERRLRGFGLAARAHALVKRAVGAGVLVRPDVCSRCGCAGRIVAHHDSYWRPLDVTWLCDERCHSERHRELREDVLAAVGA